MNGNDMAPRRAWRAGTLWCYPAAALAVLAAAALLYWLPPDETTWYPRCYLHLSTGLHCPGCGATRSVSALVHGDLAQAAAYNVLFVALLPVVALWLLLYQLGRWTGWRRLCLRPPDWLFLTLAVVMFVFGVVRNLPLEPFTSLAPHVLP